MFMAYIAIFYIWLLGSIIKIHVVIMDDFNPMRALDGKQIIN